MGAWGFEALDSDQALDWLSNEITGPAGEKIRALIDAFNKSVEDEGGETDIAIDRYGYELRAAAYVVVALNFFNTRSGDLHRELADVLGKIIDNSEWVEDWSHPDKLMASMQDQIRALKAGQNPTTLMENL